LVIRLAGLVDRDPVYRSVKKIIICIDLIIVFRDLFGTEFPESDVGWKSLFAHVAEFFNLKKYSALLINALEIKERRGIFFRFF